MDLVKTASLFSEGLLPTTSDPIDSVKYYIDKAQSVMDKIRQTQNYISNLNDISVFELPVGLPKLAGGLNYDIGIYAIRLMPTHAEVDVIMQFQMPQNGKVLTFRGNGIKFTRAGGIVGDATLSLVGDYGINFSGDKVQLILHGGLDGEKTFITMDCDGFKSMGLDAEVKFSRDVLLPEDANGNVSEGNVSATFNASLNNWNDLIIQLNLPTFQVASMPGMGFAVRDAVFDFSDFRNAPNVTFPENYNPDYADPQLANLWRGVYLRELAVKLPPEFKKKNTTIRTELTGYDLLIDNQGFTGTIVGKNLIPLNDGDMNGWAFSVDSLNVSFRQSQLTQASFEGDIVISVSDEQTPLDYSALVSTGGNYLFNVSPGNDLGFSIWGGSTVDIYEASYLEVRVENKRFLPKAVLHGKMDIRAKLSEGGQGIELADISFESLQIQSVKPYLKVGAFSFGSEALQQKMAGFPISIENVGMRDISDGEVGLDFNLLLNLTGESGGAFAADAGLTVIGALKTESGRQRWQYKDVDVRSISVDINGGAFKINGSLRFYKNDIAYGDGFNGVVKAEFVPNIKVNATAIFGSVRGERYWYADAMATFSPGILVFPGVAFYGFGGGAYYRMKMDTQGAGSELGKTASGVVYVPDMDSGLGIKAILNIGSAPTDQAFNGDVTFEVAFFRGGGLRTISLTGNAFIATPKIDDRLGKLTASVGKMADSFQDMENSVNDATMGMAARIADQESMINSIHGGVGSAAGSRGAISARAFIQYDFENRELHGNFNVNINLAGGLLEGNGDAVLHFAPHEWYVWVGTPDERVYLSLGIGPIRAQTTSYFMVGTKILGSPPPPEEVSKILGGMDLDYMKDLNEIGTGAGFAFGAAFDFDTGNMTFLMFYARFQAGAGFDIMIKNYGNTYCKGSNERIGINGWYANGQIYAYFTGDVGIRVKLFGRSKNFQILSIGAAAVLQAKLPNPFWMKGVVGGYYSVMGGMVKGNCKFEVELGEECELVTRSEGSAVEGLTVISQLTPMSGEKDVNVFNTPQIVFNIPVQREFKLDENGVPKSFRVKLDYFKVMADNQELAGSIEWNEAQDVVAFNSFEVLPPQKTIKVLAQVSFEELNYGSWRAVFDNGKPIIEKQEVSFETGVAPDYIPLSNVKYSYPVIGQLNFHKDESTEGYIQLYRGQGYLFEREQGWTKVGRFTDTGSTKTEYDVAYNSGRINFVIPSGKLKLNEIYAFELYKIPTTKAGEVDRNVSDVTNKIETGNQQVDLEMKTREAEGSIEEVQEKAMFTGYFKASKYATLRQKVAAMSVSSTLMGLRVPWRVFYLKGNYFIDEPFDKVELSGSEFTGNKPLLQLEASLSDNDFYTNEIFPLVYQGYPIDGDIEVEERDVSVLGIPPVKAVTIVQSPADGSLNQNDLTYSHVANSQYLLYDLPYYYNKDLVEIRTKVVQRYLNSTKSTPRTERIIWGLYPVIPGGTYKVNVGYYLPGKETSTSTGDVVLINTFE